MWRQAAAGRRVAASLHPFPRPASVVRRGLRHSTRANRHSQQQQQQQQRPQQQQQHSGSKSNNTQAERNRTVGILATTVIVGVLGASYASVPLYRLFCQATGYGGTTQVQSEEEVAALVSDTGARRQRRRAASLANRLAGREEKQDLPPLRPLSVSFNSDVNNKLPWRFRPLQKSVIVVPGESVLAFYRAKNLTDKPIIGVSTYNVTPSKMGQYFNKVQCFCFEEQQLDPGEEVDMPVLFYIDPEMVDDPTLKDVDSITLSYTFFRASDYNSLVEEFGVDESGAIHAPANVGSAAVAAKQVA